jgi:NAD(P)-dependent dehydrogenase (short-subunit alcohol dehydrogenase family)
MAPNKTVVETTSREWKRALDVNLRAPFLLAKGVIRPMAQRGGGTIVNIGSGGSEVGIPGRAAYCASKAGLVRFTESLAAEVRDLSIEVFCLEPRRIETAAAAEARSGGLELRPGRPPEEILPALLFLLSGRAGHLSGSNLHMDQVWLWSD